MSPDATQRDLGFPLEAPDVSPCAVAIEREMAARGWSLSDLALRMGPRDEYDLNYLSVEILLALRSERSLLVGEDSDAKLARAFGVAVGYFASLHEEWRRAQ